MLAALIGTDVGSIVTPVGSLATMLVLTIARQQGEEVATRHVVALGLRCAPVVLLATTLTLAATVALAPGR